jgi:hypothetical protein
LDDAADAEIHERSSAHESYDSPALCEASIGIGISQTKHGESDTDHARDE